MSRSPCCSQWLRSQRPQARKPRSNRANHKRIADEHPAILPAQSGHVSYEADREQAKKTRHKFYDMAPAEKALIASSPSPPPTPVMSRRPRPPPPDEPV